MRQFRLRHRVVFKSPVLGREDLSNLYTSVPTSHSREYPAVPKPEPLLSPTLIAARWQSHDLYGERMPGVAADLLEAGYDTPALRRLSGEMNIESSADAEPFVGRMFRELGVHYPISDTHAKLIVSRQVAREAIAGNRNAWAAASHLEIAVWGWRCSHPLIATLLTIKDEIEWERRRRRSLEDLTGALLDCFASIALIDNNEIFR